MAKSSRKRFTRYEKDQSGCMWGFINIFDFRHGRPSQKLLSDKKHGSRRVAGATYPDNKVEDLTHSSEDNDENGTVPVDTCMRSVKKLMEEEMIQLDHRKLMGSDVHEEDQTAAHLEGIGKKIRSRKSKMSFDLNDNKFVSDRPTHRKHRSLSSLDVNSMVAELCTQFQHGDVNHLNDEAASQSSLNLSEEESSSAVEEKLAEATKVLVKHFTDGRNLARDGKVQPSNELLEALRVLNLNKDVFLKLLQDPDSQLIKHINYLQQHLDDRHENSVEKLDKGNNNRHESFFWRRFKGLERNLSKKAEDVEDTSNIVVLKPGPFVSQDNENRCQSEKASSPRFSFFAFTRKLKRAMRKEQPNTGNFEKGVGEGFSMASPSREHFFIEKLPKSPLGSKRVDKVPSDIGSTPEQRISNIYIEARKHLAEIVGGGNGVDVDFSGRQVPKSLGRILAYADYSSSPLCSPRKDSDRSLLTSPRGMSPKKECQAGNDVSFHQVQGEINTCLPNSVEEKKDNGLCAVAEERNFGNGTPKSEVSDEINQDCRVNESSISAIDKAQVQEDTEITMSSRLPEKCISSDTISESCIPLGTKNEQVDELLVDCMKKQPVSVNMDLDENESTSFPVPRASKDDEDQYVVIERPDEPSPISVLDLTVHEDDLTPPIAKSVSGKIFTIEQQIQPRKIKFEEPSFSYIPCSGRWAWEDEKSSVFELVKVIMQESSLTWDEINEKSILSDHVLEPTFFDELEFIPDLHSYDPQLLLDLISEVLDEMGRKDVSGILSSRSPHIAPDIKGKEVTEVLWEEVEWHLLPDHGPPRTLDQIITKDYGKSGRWMDLRVDRENVGSGMEEAIIGELVEDIILSCFGWNSEDEPPVEIESE